MDLFPPARQPRLRWRHGDHQLPPAWPIGTRARIYQALESVHGSNRESLDADDFRTSFEKHWPEGVITTIHAGPD